MNRSQYSTIGLRAARSFRLSPVFLAAISLLSAGVLQAQLINVDFNENSSASSGEGPNPGPTMSGAAVLGTAGDLWNGVDVSSGTGIPLAYANGSTSPVTMTFSSEGGYDVNSYGGSTPFGGTAYDALTEDYLYSGGVPRTIILSGLAAYSVYHLVLYNAANTAAAGRTTCFTANNIEQCSTWDGSSGTLIAGVDYVDFPSVLSDDTGNLVITYTGNGTAEGDIDGFQVQSVSTPSLTINATYDGTNVVISFPTQSGFNYQVQYKNDLADTNWVSLGSSIPGNNAVQSVNYLVSGSSRFYRVQMSTNTPVGLSMLHADGTSIVNAGGVTVQLRGLNLGGWLVMEKWMCPLDSGSLPDTYSVVAELDNRFGVAAEQSLIRTYQTNWINPADLDNITNAGYNCVRVPVWWGNFYSISNTTATGWRSDSFTVLDWLVSNCAVRGIYVVIDLHGVVGGQSTSDTTGQQNQNQYWSNSTDQSETAYMWRQIAAHYNGNGTIAGYDLINEPIGAPNTSAVWSAYDSLYNAIRSVDKNHIIIMEGTFGNWNWNMLPNPTQYRWTNIVYSMHEYQWGATNAAGVEAGSDHQVTDFNNHKSWNVPDYIGEWNDMGMGAACYNYSINDYDGDGISWTMWTYKAAAGLVPNGWGWYDPIYWPPTPNISSDSPSTISNDWQQWQTTKSFGVNTAVGL